MLWALAGAHIRRTTQRSPCGRAWSRAGPAVLPAATVIGGYRAGVTADAPVAEVDVEVAASVGAAWDAFAVREHRDRWWAGLDIDFRPGGLVLERWSDDTGRPQLTRGEVVGYDERQRAFSFRWADDGWEVATTVAVHVEEVAGGARLVVRESGFERLPDGVDIAAAHAVGWRMHLEELRRYVEGRGAHVG